MQGGTYPKSCPPRRYGIDIWLSPPWFEEQSLTSHDFARVYPRYLNYQNNERDVVYVITVSLYWERGATGFQDVNPCRRQRHAAMRSGNSSTGQARRAGGNTGRDGKSKAARSVQYRLVKTPSRPEQMNCSDWSLRGARPPFSLIGGRRKNTSGSGGRQTRGR